MHIVLKDNKIWLGDRNVNEDIWFVVADGYEYEKIVDGKKIKHIMGCWFTNIDHGKRHQPLQLMSMEDNIRYSSHKEIKGKGYLKYATFNAIDIPYADAIPKDYSGIMGVPKTFLSQYCPVQFEILGYEREDENIKVGIAKMPESFLKDYRANGGKGHYTSGMRMLCLYDYDGFPKIPFSRILIRYTEKWLNEHYNDFNQQ